jgi:hypothetical protein
LTFASTTTAPLIGGAFSFSVVFTAKKISGTFPAQRREKLAHEKMFGDGSKEIQIG